MQHREGGSRGISNLSPKKKNLDTREIVDNAFQLDIEDVVKNYEFPPWGEK